MVYKTSIESFDWFHYTPELITHLPSDARTSTIPRFWAAAMLQRMFPLVPNVTPAALVGISTTIPLKTAKCWNDGINLCSSVTNTMSVLGLIEAADARVLSDILLVVPGIITPPPRWFITESGYWLICTSIQCSQRQYPPGCHYITGTYFGIGIVHKQHTYAHDAWAARMLPVATTPAVQRTEVQACVREQQAV